MPHSPRRTRASVISEGRENGWRVRWCHRAAGFRAIDYLYQSWAYEAHDVGTTPGMTGTEAALASIRARTLVLAPPLDLFNPAHGARSLAAAIPGARFTEIPSAQGHQSATSQRPEDAAFLDRMIAGFLAT